MPDVFLYCGAPIEGEAGFVRDAVFPIEIVSPATAHVDAGRKLDLYTRLPSFQAYLLVYPEDRRGVLHARTADGGLRTRLIHASDAPEPAAVAIDPPGIALDVAALLRSL